MTTLSAIVCTVVGGALLTGPPIASVPAAAPPLSAGLGRPASSTGPASVGPPASADRLAELHGVERHVLPPPARPPVEERPASRKARPARTALPTESVQPGRPARSGPATQAARPRRTATTRRPAASRPRGTAPPSRPRVTAPPSRPSTSFGRPPRAFGDGSVVGFAMAQVGKGYAFGSTGPDRFDCSGLVVAAYRQVGLSLPRSTGGLAAVGRPVGRDELRPGDLVFPSNGHVGIYIGGGLIVHASTERGGVKVSPIYAFRFARRLGG